MTDRLPLELAAIELNETEIMLGLAIAAGIVGLMLLLRAVGTRLLAGDPDCLHWRGIIGRVLAKTGVLFMIVTALEIVATHANVLPRVARISDIAFIIAASLQGAVWARELVLGVLARRIGDDRESTIGNATAIIRVLVSVSLFAVAIIVILDNLGVNVTALVAGLGVGGIAIGLAAQGIFSDLFAALAILFDRPFRRGDLIRYDNTTGTVEKIGLKTTRLRSLSGEQVVMANTKLLEREIHNLAEAAARRVTLPFTLPLDLGGSPLEQVTEIASAAAAAQPGCTPVRCVLTAIAPPGLSFELVYDDRSLDNDRVARNRSAVLMRLLGQFSANGISLVPPPAPAPGPVPAPAAAT